MIDSLKLGTLDVYIGYKFSMKSNASITQNIEVSQFALQVAQLTLASLLHGFDLETPFDETVDKCPSVFGLICIHVVVSV